MASIYRRQGSPFWWIKFRDPVTRKTVRRSTRFRVGIGSDYMKAKELCARHTQAESKLRSFQHEDRWGNWVPGYLESRYGQSPKTFQRIRTNWHFLARYLEEKEILTPQEVTRQHCLDFIPWRRQKNRSKGFNGVSHNTAILELKILSILLSEAMRRGRIQSNCCRDLGLKRVTPKPKPEITDAEIAQIREGIAVSDTSNLVPIGKYDWKRFLRVSFEIAIHQGCRLSETHLDVFRDVDLDQQLIRFHAKGDQYYETLLNPALIPLFKELRAGGQAMTYEVPKNRGMLSLAWHKFLKKLGLSHLTFHSTRVTVVSRLERAGAPEPVVMSLVHHASTTVHRVYRRLLASELRKFWPKMPDGQQAAETAHGSQSDASSASASSGHGPVSSGSRSRRRGPGASTSEPSSG